MHYPVTIRERHTKQENRWKRKMLPKWLLPIKGRTWNPTLLVYQDSRDKENNLLYEKNKER